MTVPWIIAVICFVGLAGTVAIAYFSPKHVKILKYGVAIWATGLLALAIGGAFKMLGAATSGDVEAILTIVVISAVIVKMAADARRDRLSWEAKERKRREAERTH